MNQKFTSSVVTGMTLKWSYYDTETGVHVSGKDSSFLKGSGVNTENLGLDSATAFHADSLWLMGF